MSQQPASNRRRNITLYILIIGAIIAIVIGERNNADNPSAIHNNPTSLLWFLLVPAIVVVVFFAYLGFLYARTWWQDRPFRQIAAGNASSIRDEYAAKVAAGDVSARTCAVLAWAHLHNRDYPAAERIARESLDRLAAVYLATPPQKRQSIRAHELNNTALLLTYALTHQGRFQEAAEILRQHHYRPMVGHAQFTAQLFHLAGDEASARAALGDLRITPETPPPPRFAVNKPDQEIDIAQRQPITNRLLIAYLRHKLYDEDPRPIYRKYAAHIPVLEQVNPVFEDSPFIQRTKTMKAEIRALAGKQDA